MRKICLLFLLAVIISCTSYNKCDLYRSGKFIIKSRIDNSYSVIFRSDSLQTDTNSKTGKKIISKVKWIGDCEYNLYYSTDINIIDTVYGLSGERVMNIQILEAEDDYCIFKAQIKGVKGGYVDTMRIAK